MHAIQQVFRIGYFLHLTFEDDSVRAIDMAPYFKIDASQALEGEPNLAKVLIHPESQSIIWDDGTEISADFLYSSSRLIGWVDRTLGSNVQIWRPIRFDTALIKIEMSNNELHSYLLLDGKPHPALGISSATFGIHEHVPWWHMPFPGDEGVYEPEWEEPQIVFDTLEHLVQMVNNALEKKSDMTINITEYLQQTGGDLYVVSISPRDAAIYAEHFRGKVT